MRILLLILLMSSCIPLKEPVELRKGYAVVVDIIEQTRAGRTIWFVYLNDGQTDFVMVVDDPQNYKKGTEHKIIINR